MFGFVSLGVGVWLHFDVSSFLSIATAIAKDGNTKIREANDIIEELRKQNVLEDFSNMLIAVGIFIVIISFIGCYGSIKESRCLLIIYVLLLFVLLLGQIGSVVCMNVGSSSSYMNIRIKNILEESIKEHYYGIKERNAVTRVWDYAMAKLHCCGVNNYTDFEQAHHFKNQVVPETCCKLKVTNDAWEKERSFIPVDNQCINFPTKRNSYKYDGCFVILISWVNNHFWPILVFLTTLVGFQVIAIFAAVSICRAIISHNHRCSIDWHPIDVQQDNHYSPTEYYDP